MGGDRDGGDSRAEGARADAPQAPPCAEGTGGIAPPLLARLREGFGKGARTHGPLAIPFEVYAPRVLALARRRLLRAGMEPSEASLAAVLDRAALEDLYLSLACEEGIPGAWTVFLDRYGPRVRSFARCQGATGDQVDSLAGEMGGIVLLPPARGGCRTRLGTFDGTGSLAGWLAAVVAHRLADLRAEHRSASLDEFLRWEEAGRGRADPAAEAGEDPAARAEDREAAGRFGVSLRRAWAGLTVGERSALVWKYRDGLSQVEIARRLGVGPPRVSRIVSAAHRKLREAVEGDLGEGGVPGPGGHSWRALRDAAGIHLATSVLPGDIEEEDPSSRG